VGKSQSSNQGDSKVKKKKSKCSRVGVASFPKLDSMNVTRQNGKTACAEMVEEDVKGFERIIRFGKRTGKSSYTSIISNVEHSRQLFTKSLKDICAKIEERQRSKFLTTSSNLRRIAGNEIASKLGALKAHDTARMIQGWYRKAKRRKHFKAKLDKLRHINTFCRRHVAQYRLRRAVVLCQAHLQMLLVQNRLTEKRRLHRIEKLTRKTSAKRIWNWYKYYASLKRSRKIWLKKNPDKSKKYWRKEVITKLLKVQNAWRQKLARRRVDWKLAFRELRRQREYKALWMQSRKLKIIRESEENMILTKFYVSREQEKADRVIEQEHKRFANEWKDSKLKAKMSTEAPMGKLPKYWYRKIDDSTGQELYIHEKTGKRSIDHPNMRKLKADLRKRMVEAQKKLNLRLQEIASFCNRLKIGQTTKLRDLEVEKWEIYASFLKAESVRLKRAQLILNADGTFKKKGTTR